MSSNCSSAQIFQPSVIHLISGHCKFIQTRIYIILSFTAVSILSSLLQIVYYPHECSDINISKVICFHVESQVSVDLALGIHRTECRVLFQ